MILDNYKLRCWKTKNKKWRKTSVASRSDLTPNVTHIHKTAPSDPPPPNIHTKKESGKDFGIDPLSTLHYTSRTNRDSQ